ncbi:MAG: dienelactone hydrolase family protein [Gammaproteobacteria bacterium]|nr:dienelactone hydrolase family protein [Gammaproteobacteria bacterium]
MAERFVDYQHNQVDLEGFMASPDAAGKRPAVLIAHAWAGRSPFECDKARSLAALGYSGFALDLYGKGILGQNAEQNAGLMQPFLQDRANLQARLQKALEVLRSQPEVDPERIAAIGFCFGGLCVLDLARSGADLRGVASIHGLFVPPPNISKPNITAKVLALHGHDDPMVPVDAVTAFKQEMTDAGTDWQLHVYGRTMHAFTHPEANDPGHGLAYDAKADRRSWRTLVDFLEEIF